MEALQGLPSRFTPKYAPTTSSNSDYDVKLVGQKCLVWLFEGKLPRTDRGHLGPKEQRQRGELHEEPSRDTEAWRGPVTN